MAHKYREIAYTPSVLAAQKLYYGRAQGVRPVRNDPLGPDEMVFIAARTALSRHGERVGLAVRSASWRPDRISPCARSADVGVRRLPGQSPDDQHGNVSANDRVSLFLMDYPNRTRLKILGHAALNPHAIRPISQRLAPANPEASSSACFHRRRLVRLELPEVSSRRASPRRKSRRRYSPADRIAQLEAARAADNRVRRSLDGHAAHAAPGGVASPRRRGSTVNDAGSLDGSRLRGNADPYTYTRRSVGHDVRSTVVRVRELHFTARWQRAGWTRRSDRCRRRWSTIQIEMRIAVRPRHCVPPTQHTPSRCTR